MPIYSVRIFSASNLTDSNGDPALQPNDTNGVLVGSGAYELGAGTGHTTAINDTDNGAGGNSSTAFDDGPDANQHLAEPVTLTYFDGNTTVTTTFPTGTQVQADFTVEFTSGYSILGLRFENPNAPPSIITAGYSIYDPSGNPVVPPPGTDLGSVVANDGAGTTSYQNVACFTPGCPIDTPCGARPVEDLRVGDAVLTADRGAQPITWIGRVTLLPTHTAQWPVHIPARLLGNTDPLIVSPQHRFVLQGAEVELLFGLEAVLIPTLALLELPQVTQPRALKPVHYIHFTCARHELVRASGAWTETLLAGEDLLQATARNTCTQPAARPVLKTYEARVLIRTMFRSAMAAPLRARAA